MTPSNLTYSEPCIVCGSTHADGCAKVTAPLLLLKAELARCALLCTNEQHDHVRAQVEYRRAGCSGPVDERAEEMLRTLRPWADAGLVMGECGMCHSTLAVVVDEERAA